MTRTERQKISLKTNIGTITFLLILIIISITLLGYKCNQDLKKENENCKNKLQNVCLSFNKPNMFEDGLKVNECEVKNIARIYEIKTIAMFCFDNLIKDSLRVFLPKSYKTEDVCSSCSYIENTNIENLSSYQLFSKSKTKTTLHSEDDQTDYTFDLKEIKLEDFDSISSFNVSIFSRIGSWFFKKDFLVLNLLLKDLKIFIRKFSKLESSKLFILWKLNEKSLVEIKYINEIEKDKKINIKVENFKYQFDEYETAYKSFLYVIYSFIKNKSVNMNSAGQHDNRKNSLNSPKSPISYDFKVSGNEEMKKSIENQSLTPGNDFNGPEFNNFDRENEIKVTSITDEQKNKALEIPNSLENEYHIDVNKKPVIILSQPVIKENESEELTKKKISKSEVQKNSEKIHKFEKNVNLSEEKIYLEEKNAENQVNDQNKPNEKLEDLAKKPEKELTKSETDPLSRESPQNSSICSNDSCFYIIEEENGVNGKSNVSDNGFYVMETVIDDDLFENTNINGTNQKIFRSESREPIQNEIFDLEEKIPLKNQNEEKKDSGSSVIDYINKNIDKEKNVAINSDKNEVSNKNSERNDENDEPVRIQDEEDEDSRKSIIATDNKVEMENIPN